MHESDDIGSSNTNTNKTLPVGGPVRVARLDSLKRVRGELSRLYREARRREGRYPSALEAQRLAHVLGHVRSLIELEDIERRLAALEGAAREADGHA